MDYDNADEYGSWDCIAREDNGDPYEMSGVAILVNNEEAAIIDIGHCSCYGTFDGGASVSWHGTVDELVHLAKGNLDPDMPDRVRSPQDSDSYLTVVYRQVLEWSQSRSA